MSNRAFLVVLSMLAIISRTADSLPITWYVDASLPSSGDGATRETAFKTIQEGIDAASNGDTVIVADGTYYERVRFTGKNLILRSTGPLDPDVVATTIIDADLRGSAVSFNGTEDEPCVLAGFTIQNGVADEGGGICGGRPSTRSRATIRNNIIRGNSALYYGGGIAFCGGLIQNNTVSNNSADSDGGGLYGCSGAIIRNLIAENSASQGAGLALCQAMIEDNTISGNGHSREGGGLYHCDWTIRNNRITGCSAWVGGGLAHCDGVIQGNLISQNDAEGLYECDGQIDSNIITANSGGGLHECDGTIQNNIVSRNYGKPGSGLVRCDGLIQNNTIVYNSAHSCGGAFRECIAVIRNCIIWGNRAGYAPQLYSSSQPTYSCIQEWTGGEGNILEDPRFVDPDGPDDDPETWEDNDYRLLPDSPCIDSGVNQAWMLNATDIVGNPRICQGSRSLAVDIGAYEYFRSSITRVRRTSEGEVELTWTSRPGDEYTVWSCFDLANGTWDKLGTTRAEEPWTSWMDAGAGVRTRFYRIGWTE